MMTKESVPALLRRRWRDPGGLVDHLRRVRDPDCPFAAMVDLAGGDLRGGPAGSRWGPFLDVRGFLQSLKRPVCALPIALFALALAGTLWASGPWGVRLYALGPPSKLLMLPVLLYHFERSARGLQVLIAFLVSCVLLMALSWIVTVAPGLAVKSPHDYGVPVKNYIDQSQELALCAVVLAYPVIALWQAQRRRLALLLAAVALGFVLNMLFVVVSRTALVTMPVMVAVFALLHLRWRSVVIVALRGRPYSAGRCG